MQRKKQSFIEGALILVIASGLVKAIGALFKIPLTWMIGTSGMGLFTVAYDIYSAMFVLSTAGLPVALSKMVAEASALGREREVRRTVRVAAAVFLTLGGVFSAVMLVGARTFVHTIGNNGAFYAVLAISPAIFFVAVTSVFRGYYQGLSNMTPTAISQVIEALFKMLAGLALAGFALAQGCSLPVVAAGAIAGVTIGTVMSALYLSVRSARDRKKAGPVLSDMSRSTGEIFKTLVRIAVPITIGASVMTLTKVIDLAVVMNRLQDIGYSEAQANALYGTYNSMAITLFNLPQTLITAIAISIIPAVTSAFARQNHTLATKTVGTAVRITMLLALPCGAGFLVLAKPILNLLFFSQPQDVAVAAPLLSMLGLAVPCVALVAVTNAILQAMGRADLPMYSMFAGGMLKLLTGHALVGHPAYHIMGAPISTFLCYAAIMLINLILIQRRSHALPGVVGAFIKPLAASVGMGAAAFSAYLLLAGMVGGKLAVLIAIALAMLAYLVLLLALRALSREDVLMMPKGEKLAKLLRL